LSEGRKFSYDLHYDVKREEFLYEKFVEILKDQYGNEKEVLWIEKDVSNQQYYCIDDNMVMMMPLMSPNNLLCYVIDASKFEHLEKMKNIIIKFGQKIDIINMNNIPMNKTIELMKNENGLREKIVAFIKNADLYMDNFEYVDMDQIKFDIKTEDEKPDEEVLSMKEKLMERIRLVSTYKGVPVPSLIFDSTGTKKIAAIASYIIEGLEKGRILVVDELDSSIHFKLTRAIVAMFNNELNTNAQMIFTVHDVNLMDCKKCSEKNRFGLFIKIRKVFMYIH
jgi:ABC-type ATPase involved in cell division